MLRRMMDPAAARPFLERSLPLFAGGRTHQLSGLAVLDVTAREAWVVQYSARIRDCRTGDTRTQLLTAQRLPNGALRKAAARVERQARLAAKKDPAVAGLIAQRPDVDILLFPFPLDGKLKCLPKAADPRAVRRRFQTGRCRVRVLRYVPGKRCQFLYEFDGGGVLGKVFRDDRGESLFHSMTKVADHFKRNGDPQIGTPRPLDYVADWRMLVQERAPGLTLYELLRQGAARDWHIVAAARSIALLHTARLSLPSAHFIADELALVDQSFGALSAVGFAAPQFDLVREKIVLLGRCLPPSPPVPVHRDFYDKQLLMEGPRTALIDFDTLALGCAEIDPANFIAHLGLRSVQGFAGGPAAERWMDLFLSEYNRRAPRAAGEQLLRFFLAAAYFRLACKYRLRCGGEAISPRLLQLAGAALDSV